MALLRMRFRVEELQIHRARSRQAMNSLSRSHGELCKRVSRIETFAKAVGWTLTVLAAVGGLNLTDLLGWAEIFSH